MTVGGAIGAASGNDQSSDSRGGDTLPGVESATLLDPGRSSDSVSVTRPVSSANRPPTQQPGLPIAIAPEAGSFKTTVRPGLVSENCN